MGFITILLFALVVSVVVYLTANMLHIVRLQPVIGPLESSPLVSICVPARNEERDVGACLESLLRQDYPHVEVIAIDDHSDDNTAEVIGGLAEKDARLKLFFAEPLPDGWLGKPSVLNQARRYARGEYLLFTDADPIFEPNAISSAVYRMKKDDLDLLTLMPGGLFGSFWERTVQPVIFAFIAGLTRFRKVNDPKSDKAMGVGAFLMFRRSSYDEIGGHERVRDCVVEDIALAKCSKKAGLKLLIADGKEIVSIRMYHSLKEIWLGWRKNVFIALNKSIFRALFYLLIVLGFQCGAYLVFFYNLFLAESWIWTTISTVTSLLVWITGAKLCEELRLHSSNVITFPLGAIVMAGIILNSMVQSVFLGVTEWRGRVYSDT